MSDKTEKELEWCKSLLGRFDKMNRRVRFIEPFLEPVDPVKHGAPDYFEKIDNPMDLSTMRRKLSIGAYGSAKEFKDDFDLMINNCLKYNPSQHIVHKHAEELRSEFNVQWNIKDNRSTASKRTRRSSLRNAGHSAHPSSGPGGSSVQEILNNSSNSATPEQRTSVKIKSEGEDEDDDDVVVVSEKTIKKPRTENTKANAMEAIKHYIRERVEHEIQRYGDEMADKMENGTQAQQEFFALLTKGGGYARLNKSWTEKAMTKAQGLAVNSIEDHIEDEVREAYIETMDEQFEVIKAEFTETLESLKRDCRKNGED